MLTLKEGRPRGRRSALLIGIAAAALAGPALAQSAADASGPEEVEEVVVSAQAPGSVVGDIKPDVQLSEEEIASYGAATVTELLDALTVFTGSARGRGDGPPITLVNGVRISSFREIRDLPTEAILRVDILPEEVALKYGYRADQRVVNFVLRPQFRSASGELETTVPTEGGRMANDLDVDILKIQGNSRFQLGLEASQSSALLESERDLVRDPPSRPYDAFGNLTASPASSGAQIDPALSALVGRTVTVAGLPTLAPGQTARLSDFTGAQRLTDDRPYRTLLPSEKSASINAVYTRPVGESWAFTLNGTLEANQSKRLLGLSGITLDVPATNPLNPFAGAVQTHFYPTPLSALTRDTDQLTGHLGLAANGALSGWRWSFTANADRNRTDTTTETGFDASGLQAAVNANGPVDPFRPVPESLLVRRAPDEARSTSTSGDAEATINGALFRLPAGAVTSTFSAGAETLRFDSRSTRSGVFRTTELARDTGRLKLNLDAPIARRDGAGPVWLGNLSTNVNVLAETLSDFGPLYTAGFGVNWSPVAIVRLIASYTGEEGAPTVQQLGNPLTATPGVRVFDFRRGETVEVTRLEGGSPGLSADHRRVFKLGLNLQPLDGLDIRADYVRTRTEDVISGFPTATAEIEAAFPDRFVRDATGRLVQIDARPVNFDRQDQEEIRWGFRFSRSFGAPPQRAAGGQGAGRPGAGGPGAAQAGQRGPGQGGGQAGGQGGARFGQGGPPAGGPPGGPPGGGPRGGFRGGGGGPPPGGFGGGGGPPGGFGGGGGRGGPGGGAGAGRWDISLFHTLKLQDSILIRPGVPLLDLLNGSAGGSDGGTPRHQLDLQGGVAKGGLGVRLNARWTSATTVRGEDATGADDLRFSDLTTVNLRVFANLQQLSWTRDVGWLKGSRVSLGVDNLFNQRQSVTTRAGDVPVRYQPAFLDPLGRTIQIEFRKIIM